MKGKTGNTPEARLLSGLLQPVASSTLCSGPEKVLRHRSNNSAPFVVSERSDAAPKRSAADDKGNLDLKHEKFNSPGGTANTVPSVPTGAVVDSKNKKIWIRSKL